MTKKKGVVPVFRVPNPMIFVAWLAIFIPGHLLEWWIERSFAAAVFVLGSLVLFAKPAPWESRRAARQASAFFFLIQFFFLASYVYAIAFMGIDTGVRDYFEVARYLFLWVFVLYVIRHYDQRVAAATENAAATSLYFSILVGLCYLFYVPVLSPFFKYGLYDKTKTFVNYAGTIRLAAPFENPNFLGFFAVQVLTYLLFFSRSLLRFAHVAAALLVIYFTGSRTAWAATGLCLSSAALVYAYLGALRVRLKFALQLIVGVSLLTGAGIHYWDRIMQNSRLQAIFSAVHAGGVQNESNAAGRVEQVMQVLDYSKESPILGWGPSKYATFDYVDNQYALWLLRNGALGAILITTGLLWVSIRLIRSQRGDPLTFTGALTFVGVIAVMLMTGEFLNNFRLFYLTWLFGAAIAHGRDKPVPRSAA